MIALATAMSFPGCSPKVQIPGSVEVESCDPGEAAAVAGLKAGDVVQTWRQGSANGDVASPFHLAQVEQELDAAESAYLRGLTVASDAMPGSPTEINILGNLGLVAMRRGDFESARQLFREERDKAIQLGGSNEYLGFAANYLGLLAKDGCRVDPGG